VNSEYLWCVDPLDGTTNFAHGYPSFAVCVAVLRHTTPVASTGASGRKGGFCTAPHLCLAWRSFPTPLYERKSLGICSLLPFWQETANGRGVGPQRCYCGMRISAVAAAGLVTPCSLCTACCSRRVLWRPWNLGDAHVHGSSQWWRVLQWKAHSGGTSTSM
jgi:hypothetical protein